MAEVKALQGEGVVEDWGEKLELTLDEGEVGLGVGEDDLGESEAGLGESGGVRMLADELQEGVPRWRRVAAGLGEGALKL